MYKITHADDDFPDRLGWLLLKAYAEGIHVESEWMLLDTHDQIPDIVIDIDMASEPVDDADSAGGGTVPTIAFKSALQSFLLREFGTGTCITGVWQIGFVPDSLPEWNVTIRRPNKDEDQVVRGVDHNRS